MTKNDYWDLTYRPYSRLKLNILREYLWVWAKIFFSTATKHRDWNAYQEVYYVDCFAGRGRHHFNGQQDIIDGSPLIALKCALNFQGKYKGVRMKCIFIELNKNSSYELEKFCEIYKGKVEFELYKQKDFNNVITGILNKINYHPTFFFIDPDGIKEIQKQSIEEIVNRKGATDILFNYIKGGVERITGITKSKIVDILNKKIPLKKAQKYLKTIKRLTDFYGLTIFNKLNTSEKERLKEWTNLILKSSTLKEVAVFDMPYRHKSDPIYYLLFASRKPVAKKVILSIFKKAKTTTYEGQGRLNLFDKREFEL